MTAPALRPAGGRSAGGRPAGGRWRVVPAGALAGLLALGLAGCSNHSATSYGSQLMVSRLQTDVRNIMDNVGEPVEDDDIGCHPTASHRYICYGTTVDTPVETIRGTFGPPSTRAGGVCPATLHIALGASTVEVVKENPCR